MIEIKKTDDYLDWLNDLTKKEQIKIKARISRIENDEYFGDARP